MIKFKISVDPGLASTEHNLFFTVEVIFKIIYRTLLRKLNLSCGNHYELTLGSSDHMKCVTLTFPAITNGIIANNENTKI